MRFHDDMIQRRGLPWDVRALIHDLCYEHASYPAHENYRTRAQEILKAVRTPPKPKRKVRA